MFRVLAFGSFVSWLIYRIESSGLVLGDKDNLLGYFSALVDSVVHISSIGSKRVTAFIFCF